MYFGNRRPRGFHHTFRFSNERRDILDALKRGVAPEDVARQSLEGSSDGDRKSARTAGTYHRMALHSGAAVTVGSPDGVAGLLNVGKPWT